MNTVVRLIKGSIFCLLSSAANAEGLFLGSSEIVEQIDNSISITLIDQVSDACMARPKTIENALELTFNRNEMNVSESTLTNLIIFVQGLRVKSRGGQDLGCVASIDLDIVQKSLFGAVVVYKFNDLLVGGDEKTEDIRQSVEGAAEDFIVMLSRKRQDISEAN